MAAARETFALMAKKDIAYLPTLTVCEAICEYFLGHVRGGEPHPRMVEAANAFRSARVEGVVIGLRQRCRPVSRMARTCASSNG